MNKLCFLYAATKNEESVTANLTEILLPIVLVLFLTVIIIVVCFLVVYNFKRFKS